jgi:hypothetical protein
MQGRRAERSKKNENGKESHYGLKLTKVFLKEKAISTKGDSFRLISDGCTIA